MIGAHHTENISRARARLFIILRWFAALVVLGILLYFLPLPLLWNAMQRVPVTRFIAVLLGYLFAHCLGILKWRMVVNAAGAQLDFLSSAQCYTSGLFATLFLPSIIGGDVMRLAVGLRRSPNPAAVLAGNFADRFLDMMAQAVIVILGIILLPGSLPDSWHARARNLVFFGIAIAAACVALILIFFKPLLAGRSIRFRRRLARLRHALRAVSHRPSVLFFGWILGTFIQSTFLVLTALIAISCGLYEPLRVWFFAWPLAKVAAILPLTQGGIGVREAALVGLLAPFGAPAHLVLASGLVWEGVIIAGALIAGAVAFFLRRKEALTSDI